MPKNNRTFQDLLLERLANPEVASNYLNEALGESIDSFLVALKTVAQARQMAKVAREAGIQRETLYRSLSEQGNPTVDTLSSILKAVGLKFLVTPEDTVVEQIVPAPSMQVPAITVSTVRRMEVGTTGKMEIGTTGGGTIFTSSGDITGFGSFVNYPTRGLGFAVITSPQNIDPIIDIPARNGFYGQISQ